MDKSRAIQIAGRIGSFWARHLMAVALTVRAFCALWTVVYFALLLWATFAGTGLGGPLSYPAGILVCLIFGTATSLILLFPATALAEWSARRYRFPILAQIPISVAALAFLCVAAVSVTTATDPQRSLRSASVSIGVLFLAHLVPLGLYWWTAQSGPLVVSLFRRLGSMFNWSSSLPDHHA